MKEVDGRENILSMWGELVSGKLNEFECEEFDEWFWKLREEW